jgi:hypothetical protein
MSLPELLTNIQKTPFHQRDAANFSRFIMARAADGDLDFYKVNDSNGDTYVIFKWPHKVPGLVVLP